MSGLNEFPYTEGRLINTSDNIFSVEDLPRVKGLTVNTVSGSTASISLRSDKYECDVESMEGAAFHYVCLTEGIPFLQVRAISNYVEPRDKSKWKIKEAIANLNDYLIEVLLKTKHGAI